MFPDIVLLKSDPADVLVAIRLSKAAVRKMKHNQFWAAICNVIAIPVVAASASTGSDVAALRSAVLAAVNTRGFS